MIGAIEGCRCIGVCFSTNCEKIVFADEKSGKPFCITEHSSVSHSKPLVHESGGSAKINSKVPISHLAQSIMCYFIIGRGVGRCQPVVLTSLYGPHEGTV